ncbi:MAG: ammonium transporter [Planctomycetales bacterium]|nr:ammonium transporter [Planctomycetales bacterium]
METRSWREVGGLLGFCCGLLLYTAIPLGAVSAEEVAKIAAEIEVAQIGDLAEGGDVAVVAPPAGEESEEGLSVASVLADVDVLWTCLAAFLVFFMQAGFAMVESGFTRAKNACNIMMKNLMDFSIGSIAFWMVGFGLMFGLTQGWYGTSWFFFDPSQAGTSFDAADPQGSAGAFGWAFLIFQTVFAATAATIVSGAMAERTKFVSYLCYSVGITVLVYPIFGSWCWNGLVTSTGSGWLEGKGFLDFAGSTVVHSVGGWAALAGAIVLGARKGKYTPDGQPVAIPGHNIPLAALGVFILWLGWFGFNPGSTTAVGGGDLARIAVTTNLAAAGGAVLAMISSWIMFKRPDTSFALNGALAGLVAITAGCDIMSPGMALLTGAIAGVIVVISCLAFEKIRVDDPVGAISVHGVCGAWGTLAIGVFSSEAGWGQLGIQALGVAAAFLWAFPVSLAIFLAIKATIGLRASEAHEAIGLDASEHGMHAYPPSMVVDETFAPGAQPVPVG